MSAPPVKTPTAASAPTAATDPALDPIHSSTGAAAEQSGQSRPCHVGHSPHMAAGANAADGPSPANRLHRHALESIFAFLDLPDLAAALRVTRDWLAAVHSMRRLELLAGLPSASLEMVAQSAIARHVAEVQSRQLDADTLYDVAHHMAHLRSLCCFLALPPSAVPLIFPDQLRRLDIDCSGPADADRINSAITACAQLPLLEELAIRLSELTSEVSFAPLAALQRLRSLSICGPRNDTELSDAQADQLRALPRLQDLNVEMTTSLLRRLVRRPHSLQWQQIALPDFLDNEAAAPLPQLPSLTQIHAVVVCSRFDWLRGLPNLTEVDLVFGAIAVEGCTASLMAALQCCSQIKILAIIDCADLTAAHLADLLPRLPRLRELELGHVDIDSLSFLVQPPMTRQLSSLGLDSCTGLPVGELRHVHALKGLKKLVLSESFEAPLSEHDRSLLTPPSALLPRLQEFDYRAPI